MRIIYLSLLTFLGSAITITGISFAQDYQTDHTVLILNPIPSNIIQGTTLTISGSLLNENKGPVPNEIIFIQYDSPYGHNRILTTTSTDTNGNFAIPWIAKPKLSGGGTYYLFAKFNGDDKYFFSVSKRFPLTVTLH